MPESPHNEIMFAIGKLEGSVLAMDKKFDDLSVVTRDGFKTQNGRTRKLEQWQTGMIMIGTLFVILVFPLVAYIYTNQIREFKSQIKQLQK